MLSRPSVSRGLVCPSPQLARLLASAGDDESFPPFRHLLLASFGGNIAYGLSYELWATRPTPTSNDLISIAALKHDGSSSVTAHTPAYSRNDEDGVAPRCFCGRTRNSFLISSTVLCCGGEGTAILTPIVIIHATIIRRIDEMHYLPKQNVSSSSSYLSAL